MYLSERQIYGTDKKIPDYLESILLSNIAEDWRLLMLDVKISWQIVSGYLLICIL